MKSWLRSDNVYQSIMSSALLIVFLAALSASHWPQLSVVSGVMTAVVVGIVAYVYCVVVVCGDDDRASAEQRPDVAARQQPEKEQNPVSGAETSSHGPIQRQEGVENYGVFVKRLLDERVHAAPLTQHDLLREVLSKTTREWSDRWAAAVLSWSVDEPHHGSHLIPVIPVIPGALKSHRRAYAVTRRLGSIAAGEQETGEKVVVMVGSVRIEIQEDDPNKTTTVHVSAPEPILTKVAVQDPNGESPNRPESVSQSKPSATIH
jgi:hypothetical protein